MSRPDERSGPVRLRPIRVLLVSTDRRFLRMATVVLSRTGCTVASVETPRRLAQAIEGRRTNVLVLDATGRVGDTAVAIGALEGLAAPVAVVTVAEDPAVSSSSALPMLSKWNAAAIVAAVESAYSSTGRGSDARAVGI